MKLERRTNTIPAIRDAWSGSLSAQPSEMQLLDAMSAAIQIVHFCFKTQIRLVNMRMRGMRSIDGFGFYSMWSASHVENVLYRVICYQNVPSFRPEVQCRFCDKD